VVILSKFGCLLGRCGTNKECKEKSSMREVLRCHHVFHFTVSELLLDRCFSSESFVHQHSYRTLTHDYSNVPLSTTITNSSYRILRNILSSDKKRPQVF
jgi:hypothetical protein